MKVRLKPIRIKAVFPQVEFQFHEGPIKTKCTLHDYKPLFVFQFHEGPIKTGVLLLELLQ